MCDQNYFLGLVDLVLKPSDEYIYIYIYISIQQADLMNAAAASGNCWGGRLVGWLDVGGNVYIVLKMRPKEEERRDEFCHIRVRMYYYHLGLERSTDVTTGT